MSHNSNFQGLIRRFSDNPPSVEYEEVEWKYYEGDFIFFTILFYPLLILAIPIAYTGGVLEWGYYYLESAWNGDRTQMEYLDEMWDNDYTAPTAVANQGITMLFTIPTEFWYGYILVRWAWL
jgi:hypothetical protein